MAVTDKKTKQTRRVNGQEEKIEKQKRWISREDGKQEDKMAAQDVKKEGINGLSDRIREQRKKMGITQGEMARRIGGGIRTVNDYERGTRQPSYAKLLALATLFNVSTDYLLGVKREF